MLEVPEFESTRLARERARHSSDGELTLQLCNACGRVQYPSRSVCSDCLSAALSWSHVLAAGRVIATAMVHASLHPRFREQGPWRICSVVLDVGPRVLAYVADDAIRPGDPVEIHDRQAGEEQRVLIAKRSECPVPFAGQDTREQQ
ncbi:MAG TPA: zinc ribbon domain-containing protein [Woeseiaceae bacterium]|nr:zinc ribbon domain-containing protein [Woeseiaceae bacterium]